MPASGDAKKTDSVNGDGKGPSDGLSVSQHASSSVVPDTTTTTTADNKDGYKGDKPNDKPSTNAPLPDMSAMMGFSSFNTTKNKKVQAKSSSGKRVEKKTTKAKFRQYVNRKKKLVE